MTWVQVTLDFFKDATDPNRVHYRVHWSKEEDWSGWADSPAEAFAAVDRRMRQANPTHGLPNRS